MISFEAQDHITESMKERIQQQYGKVPTDFTVMTVILSPESSGYVAEMKKWLAIHHSDKTTVVNSTRRVFTALIPRVVAQELRKMLPPLKSGAMEHEYNSISHA